MKIEKENVPLNEMQQIIHKNAIDHGWYERERPIPEMLCLVHSEVSEALEAYRVSDMGLFAEELADVAIRLFDMSQYLNINLNDQIIKKHNKNVDRPYRHGGKVC